MQIKILLSANKLNYALPYTMNLRDYYTMSRSFCRFENKDLFSKYFLMDIVILLFH